MTPALIPGPHMEVAFAEAVEAPEEEAAAAAQCSNAVDLAATKATLQAEILEVRRAIKQGEAL